MFVEPNCGTIADPTSWTFVDLGLAEYSHDGFSGLNVPNAQGLLGVAYGNGLFVAPALSFNQDKLQWVTSEDAMTWTPHTQLLPAGVVFQSLRKIHYQNGKFVFFGRQNLSGVKSLFVYTSTDALTWTATKVADAPSPVIEEFDSSGSLTVLVGDAMRMNSSPDLITWSAQSVMPTGTFDFFDVAFGAGRWVAGINVGTTVFTSADAVTWTPVETMSAQHIEFGRGQFVAMGSSGSYYTSTDGLTFTAVAPIGLSGNRAGARFAGNRFLMPAPSSWVASSDLTTWTAFGVEPRGGNDGGYGVNLDVAYGRCRYVAAGRYAQGTIYSPYVITASASPAP